MFFKAIAWRHPFSLICPQVSNITLICCFFILEGYQLEESLLHLNKWYKEFTSTANGTNIAYFEGKYTNVLTLLTLLFCFRHILIDSSSSVVTNLHIKLTHFFWKWSILSRTRNVHILQFCIKIELSFQFIQKASILVSFVCFVVRKVINWKNFFWIPMNSNMYLFCRWNNLRKYTSASLSLTFLFCFRRIVIDQI